jgi:sugar phosphate isomerase/epimerase
MLKIAVRLDEKKIDGSTASLREMLDYFQKLGIEAIEVPVHGLNVIRNGVLDRKLMREAVSIIQGYDFSYGIHAPDPVNLMHTVFGELHKSVLRSTLEFASEINAPVVVCHAGQYISNNEFPMHHKSSITEDEQTHLLAVEAAALREVSMEFPSITIAVENARPYLMHSPYCYAERTEALRRQIFHVARENVGVTLDVGHLYLAAKLYGFDLIQELSHIEDIIVHCHIHDNFGIPTYYHEKEQTHLLPFGRGDCHMPVGWGEIPIGQILSRFIAGFEGMLVLELRGRYHDAIQESVEMVTSMCLDFEGIWHRSAMGE